MYGVLGGCWNLGVDVDVDVVLRLRLRFEQESLSGAGPRTRAGHAELGLGRYGLNVFFVYRLRKEHVDEVRLVAAA